MKFNIEVATLAQITHHVNSVVDKRHTTPILANVLIEAEPSFVLFRTTDLNCEIEVTVVQEPEVTGAITVPIATLFQIARVLPNNAIAEFEFDEVTAKVTLTSGNTSYVLATLPAEDFPRLAQDDYIVNFEVNASVFKRIFEKTKFAISQDDTRRQLNGVNLQCKEIDEDIKLVGVAVDGFQMAVINGDAPQEAVGLEKAIIPEKAVLEFPRMFDENENITVSASEGKLQFKSGSKRFMTRLIETDYPDFMRLIPQDNNLEMTVKAKDLLNAINRVATIVSEGDCKITFAITENELELSATAVGRGQSSDTIAVIYNENDFKVKFGFKSLVNILSLMPDGITTFKFASDNRAVLILDSSDVQCKYIVMPSR